MGLVLLDDQVITLDIVPPHYQYVRWALARQIRQVHGILQLRYRLPIDRIPYSVIGIEVARFLFVLSHALARVLLRSKPPFSRHVENVGEGG
ncbi:hypothetical protein D3C77_627400 [compost metagenome]